MSISFFNSASNRYVRLFAYGLSLSMMLTACSPTKGALTELKITGSSTVAPVMVDIVRHYNIFHPDITVEIGTGGSNQGIEDVRQGNSDIGMVSRSLKPEEKGLEAFTIARDGISLLVHYNNPVTELSKQQIVDIYTGKTNSWQAITGKPDTIEVLSKTQNHAALSLFSEYFSLTTDTIKADRLLGDNQEVMQAVLDNPNAIGYVSIGAAEYKIIHGMPLKLLPLEGVDATIHNVGNGEFPLARPLNLITSQPPTSEQKKLIEFSLSAEVENIIQEKAFVPTVSQ